MDAKESRIYAAIIIACLIIGFIIFYFIVSIIRQHRRNMMLHRKNILAEITHIEQERSRIAADLHDEFGPLLSAVKMKINSFTLSDREDNIQLSKINENIDDMVKRFREISYDLMPNSLVRKGLVTSVKEFIAYLSTSTKIHFIFKADKDLELSEQNAVNIYRIIQETLHNSIKHAQATELNTQIKIEKNIVVIIVSDNGIGFDYEKESKESTGFGLRSLLSRTEIMGGRMFLDSEKGMGTTYTFEIPV